MSLVLTRIQNMRANSNFDRFEYRLSRYGALDAFLVQSADPAGILTDELKEKARLSIGNTLETPVIDYDADVTIGNTRELTITDSENTSRMVTINFSTLAWGFTMTPATFMNNEIRLQKDFETKMKKYILKAAAKLDEMALAALASAKTQVLKDKLLYDFSGNQLKATWEQRENLFGDIDVMMHSNDFYEGIHLIGDTGMESIMNKLQQKGLYNEVNKQNEFGNKVVHISNGIAATPGLYSQGYAVAAGSLGMLTRFERDCLMGSRSGDGHEWGIATLPILNTEVGTYFYDSVGDYSGIAGAATADMVRTRKEHYGFALDVAFVTAYNSAPETNAGPILNFSISSENASYAKPVVVVNTAENPVNTKEAGA